MASVFQFTKTVASRDLFLATRSGGGWLQGIVFYAVFVAFMAFGFGPDQASLRMAASPTVWLATLFAIQLSASDMFLPDLEDGTLHVFCAEQPSLIPYVVGKILAVLIMVAGPLVIATPFVLLMFSVGDNASVLAIPAIIIGSVALSLAAVIASAINAALKGGSRFTTILSAPLSIPIIIFGIDAVQSAIEDSQIWSPEMQLLLATTLFLIAIVPGFSVLALRLGLE